MAAPLASTLRIAISGAGMGGLATALALAHQGFSNISIYESASNLGFVGAGIQVAPNLSRVLQKLGAWDHLKDNVVEMKEASIRASATDEELAHVGLTHIPERYGHPHCVAHRSSLASALYDGCKTMGSAITFHFRTNVLDIDFDHTRLLVKERGEQGNGRWIDTDVILAADGVKSLVRKHMVARNGEEDNVKDTGQAAYRIMLTRDQMAHDPELLALVESNTTFRWIGPRRHIIAYPVSRNTIFNISSAQPDVNFAGEPDSTWTAKSDKGAMLKMYSDFCPLVMRLLQLVPEGDVCEWKLRVHAPLKTWIEGNVALVGDACHPTLPHLNQGAAQAIEDGAVLGVVLGKLTDKKGLHAALKVYERLRKQRAEYLVEQAAASGRTLQLTDPTAQAQRDEAFRQVKNGGPNPDKAVDREVQDYVFGYDCIADAESHFDEFLAVEKST
ncbi:FAD/NAD(P)-binding domain-containing protein [Athelia psychrophila]|uniref:FAD/NAD(P)-binding domain-containing protein n=1 Tax=Athelia psychrophila TaxID=1759441 RepID=A0A166IAL9_9AGAM|nr:FAD/NAD(P)-binding domain-containing protein [Fibularhizoctonia sp. CBS 109695]